MAKELGIAPNTLSRWVCQLRNEKAGAAADLNWWIGVWYNQKSLHSSLGYKSPSAYGREKNVA